MPTITGTFTRADGTYETLPIRFRRVPLPDEESGSIISQTEVSRYPNATGQISLTLVQGLYRVFIGSDTRFLLATVGASNADLSDIITVDEDTELDAIRLRSPDDGNLYTYRVRIVNGYPTLRAE